MLEKSKYFLYLSIFISIGLSEFPITLDINESYIYDISLYEDSEYLLDITCSSNTSWQENGNESSILSLFIDGNYNQDVILYNGIDNHTYKQAIGFLEEGTHTIEIIFDYNKSSQNSNVINVDNILFYNTDITDIDSDIFKYSPIIYGRNIFNWNESNHTDIPLLMYYDISYEDFTFNKTITYGIIFSNEDSRVGIGLSDMMLSWGRTTDIEWVYTIILNQQNEIIEEVFQGAGHITTNFDGEKYGTHPYLINATANCNFSDTGTSDYKLFLSPNNSTDSNHTREHLMDQNSWIYKIMAHELINENKYEDNQDPTHWELSDVRNYIYLEYNSSQSGTINDSKIYALFYNDCYHYSNTHNDLDIEFNIGNGIRRTAIELPEGFSVDDLKYLSFYTDSDSEYLITINSINKLFFLSDDYNLINIDTQAIEFPLQVNNANPEVSIIINNQNLSYDCNSEFNGNAYCDDCNICSGGNTENVPNSDVDECGICFGNNQSMDCEGTCFGNAYIDNCYVCDSNPNNDEQTCNAGCFDSNADNYDSNATIFDNSCIYSDRIFNVPTEYMKIQDAIFFSSSQDTILVQPGTYYEHIDFLEKDIIIISSSGPEHTYIVANSDDNENSNSGVFETDHSVVTIENITENTAVLDGFTLQNGYGKGVNFEYFISVAADPDSFNDMMHNLIKSGGISSINSSITLSNLIIKNNSSVNFGAGIGLVDSHTNINNVLIENNHIPDGDALGGSGVAINGGVTSINNCILRNNSVGLNLYQLNGGGGILCGFNFSGTPLQLTVTNSEIYNNSANIGAAIGALSGNITLDRNLIYGNTGEFGSTISLGEPLGLVIDDINILITNSTLVNNNGSITFGMIDNSTATIANSILWNNGISEFTSLPNNSILNINALHSNIKLYNESEQNTVFSSDPQFIDYENHNYNLYANSPCIDNGVNHLVFDQETIIDLQPEEYTGILPDIGYFELKLAGDLNEDNQFNIFDIILLVEMILLESIYISSADLNQDGLISVIDIVQLINLILNN